VIAIEDEDAGVVVAKPELLLRADHAVRLDAPDGALGDLEVAGQYCAGTGHGHGCAGFEIPRPADDLSGAGAAVDLAYPNLVGVGMGGNLQHLPDVDIRPVGFQGLDCLDRVPQHVEGVGELAHFGGGQIDEL
jgi:hypothetical protein